VYAVAATHGTGVARFDQEIAAHPGREPRRREIMLRKGLAAMFVSLFITGAAFANPPASGRADPEKAGKMGEALTVLHAVGQWSTDISKMAEQRAKSDLVKNYAREMATANAEKDAKLMSVAQKHGMELAPLDPQTEEGKSLRDRIQAETRLLSSLSGDAFDKEYMTLVTNTQQSVIRFLEAHKAAAKDPDVKQVLGDMTTTVQNRLKTAQDILAKVYGDRI
jgi:predicted outer membrane protein